MTIIELQQQYAAHPNTAVMERLLKDASVQTIFCGGLCASSASLFSSVLVKQDVCPFVFVLGDLEEAGYFYHDLTQVLGTEKVFFFPSSFRRSIKYGQKDAANEILRTEVLSRLQKGEEGLCIVTYPDALAEKVVSRKELSDKTLKLNVERSWTRPLSQTCCIATVSNMWIMCTSRDNMPFGVVLLTSFRLLRNILIVLTFSVTK